MPIPTLLEFQTSTAQEGKLGKRGTVFAMVDASIEEWHSRRQVATVNEKVGILYQLMKEAAKANQKIKPKGSVGKKNALAHRRKHQLEQLYIKALEELGLIAPGIFRGLQRFTQRKELLGARSNVIGLSRGYHNERVHYLATGKQFAYAGSNVHPTHDNLRNERQFEKNLQRLARKSFDSLTPNDFEFLALHGGGHRVTFYNKIERLQYMIVPDGNGGFEDLNGDPVHMNDWGRKYPNLYMYAIDRYGNVFTRKAPDHIQNPDGYINHSSFNAGREVMCAGCIWIANGKLRHIDNNSGHYKPGTEELRNALVYLFEEGIDISETRIVDMRGPKHQGTHAEFFALNWLNGNRIPDFTENDERRLGLMLD